MKPELTQQELEELYTSGKTCIWQYKTRYEVGYLKYPGYYCLWKTGRFDGKQGITKRGRFIATTPEEGREMELKAYEMQRE